MAQKSLPINRATEGWLHGVAVRFEIPLAALRAVIDVESGGRAFARIPRERVAPVFDVSESGDLLLEEPLIRFEGHYFDRLIADETVRDEARAAGLASPKAGRIRNSRRQKDRWQTLAEAVQRDRAAALQSVSWGLGQVMGANWRHLGYADAEAFVREVRSGIEGQVHVMLQFIRANGLTVMLQRGDWEAFARRYNGPNFHKNGYDWRLKLAYEKYNAYV